MKEYLDDNVKAMVSSWTKDSQKQAIDKKVVPIVEKIRFGVIDKYGILIVPNPAKCIAINRLVDKEGNLTDTILANLEVESIPFSINIPFIEGIQEMIALNVD